LKKIQKKKKKKMKMFNKKYITIIMFAASVLFTAPHFFGFFSKNISKIPDHSKQSSVNYFYDISLQAEAAFVYDIKKNEILFSKNEEMQLPLASLTKIMTALVALENSSKNKTISITSDTLEPEGDSGFSVGERWNIRNLIDFTLLESSNDGARALASSASSINGSFITTMNKKAEKIGMEQTFFLNESGLDTSKNFAGSYGSAKDMALLFAYVLSSHPELFEATVNESLAVFSSEKEYEALNTNKYVSDIPGLVASKTGFTDLAGGNLIVIFEAGPLRPIIVSVLGSSADGRFSDVKNLINTSIATITGTK